MRKAITKVIVYLFGKFIELYIKAHRSFLNRMYVECVMDHSYQVDICISNFLKDNLRIERSIVRATLYEGGVEYFNPQYVTKQVRFKGRLVHYVKSSVRDVPKMKNGEALIDIFIVAHYNKDWTVAFSIIHRATKKEFAILKAFDGGISKVPEFDLCR